MSISQTQDFVLSALDIDLEYLASINLDIQTINEILQDYSKSQEDLYAAAEHIAKRLQPCKQVHSVRWRVKDPNNLIKKIIRKKAEKSEKYTDINASNYKTKLDDLIGVRAIYLFKQDWLPVHQHILSRWTPKEKVTVYYREGDDLEQYLDQPDCRIKQHNDSYRSIHYIVPACHIHNQAISCEIQTRTIFEEGWSEIDHKVRYPNFSKDPNLKDFLDTFNRLAGSADEMGTFVITLKGMIESKARAKQEMQDNQIMIKELEDKIDSLLDQIKDHEELKQAFRQLKNTSNTLNKEIIDNRVAEDSRKLSLLSKLVAE